MTLQRESKHLATSSMRSARRRLYVKLSASRLKLRKRLPVLNSSIRSSSPKIWTTTCRNWSTLYRRKQVLLASMSASSSTRRSQSPKVQALMRTLTRMRPWWSTTQTQLPLTSIWSTWRSPQIKHLSRTVSSILSSKKLRPQQRKHLLRMAKQMKLPKLLTQEMMFCRISSTFMYLRLCVSQRCGLKPFLD